MTIRNKDAHGSILLVVLVVVLLVGALGFVGWRMLTKQNDENQSVTSSAQNSAEVILTQEDLEAAEKSLDELDFVDENSEKAELQAEL